MAGVLCLGSAGSLPVPCLGSVCLVLTCSKRSKSGKGSETTKQPPSAAGGGCDGKVVAGKPLPRLELVKARQTEPRQGTASEPAEPRQSTPGEVAEPSQATLSARGPYTAPYSHVNIRVITRNIRVITLNIRVITLNIRVITLNIRLVSYT